MNFFVAGPHENLQTVVNHIVDVLRAFSDLGPPKGAVDSVYIRHPGLKARNYFHPTQPFVKIAILLCYCTPLAAQLFVNSGAFEMVEILWRDCSPDGRRSDLGGAPAPDNPANRSLLFGLLLFASLLAFHNPTITRGYLCQKTALWAISIHVEEFEGLFKNEVSFSRTFQLDWAACVHHFVSLTLEGSVLHYGLKELTPFQALSFIRISS